MRHFDIDADPARLWRAFKAAADDFAAAYNAASDLGYVEAKAAGDRQHALFALIRDAEPKTLGGVIVQARLLAWSTGIGRRADHEVLAAKIVAGLERLERQTPGSPDFRTPGD